MTNDEIPKGEGMTKHEAQKSLGQWKLRRSFVRHSSFGFLLSLGISSFVISRRHFVPMQYKNLRLRKYNRPSLIAGVPWNAVLSPSITL